MISGSTSALIFIQIAAGWPALAWAISSRDVVADALRAG